VGQQEVGHLTQQGGQLVRLRLLGLRQQLVDPPCWALINSTTSAITFSKGQRDQGGQ